MRKMLYTHTTEFYLAVKKNGIPFVRKWIGTGDHYIKWNQAASYRRQVLHVFWDIWNLKKENAGCENERGIIMDVEGEKVCGDGIGKDVRKFQSDKSMVHVWMCGKIWPLLDLLLRTLSCFLEINTWPLKNFFHFLDHSIIKTDSLSSLISSHILLLVVVQIHVLFSLIVVTCIYVYKWIYICIPKYNLFSLSNVNLYAYFQGSLLGTGQPINVFFPG